MHILKQIAINLNTTNQQAQGIWALKVWHFRVFANLATSTTEQHLNIAYGEGEKSLLHSNMRYCKNKIK